MNGTEVRLTGIGAAPGVAIGPIWRYAARGTAAAATRLVEALGGIVVGLSFLIELTALDGRAALPGRDIQALIAY